MRFGVLLTIALIVLAGCPTPGTAPSENPTEPCGALDGSFTVDPAYNPTVRLETSKGPIEAMVYANQVPLTSQQMLAMAADGTFEGTRFHQLSPGVAITGGDPLTTSDNKAFWGTGGGDVKLPDEVHQFLRHDEPGILSMANQRPNQASSIFTIHLQERPDRNDFATVWGKVTDGLDVVHNLSETPTDDRQRPQFNARIDKTSVQRPSEDPSQAPATLSSFGYDCEQTTEPGGTAEFLTVVRNTGQRILNATFETQAPDGWSVELRNAERIVVASGQSVAYVLDIHVPENATRETQETVEVTFQDSASTAQTSLDLAVNVGTVGPTPSRGDPVAVRYVGVLEDGRPFDTTVETYATMGELGWFKAPPTHLEPLPFEIGDGQLIEGFDDLVARTPLGASSVAVISPDQGYGTDDWGRSDLGGRLLAFQVQLVELDGSEA